MSEKVMRGHEQESPGVFPRNYNDENRNTSSVQEALIFASLKVALEGKGRLVSVITSGMTRVFIP